MPDSQNLRILLLGTPSIYYNDRPLQIQRRLMRWMLFYLACQKEMVGRSDLILLFWPDENEEDARRHLRETLSKLRTQLPNPNLIITDQDKVGLDLQYVYSDVLEFQSLFNQTARVCAQTPASSPLSQAVYEKVLRAVRLWRCERFLAGTPVPESEAVANWQLQTSQQIEIHRQRLLERLVDHDTATGDMEGAVHWLRLALDGDETNESLNYRLLTLLHKQGRYSEVMSYGSYLQEVYRREGSEELPPSLLVLYKKIREEAAQPESGDRSNWPAKSNTRVPFVGRETILRDVQFAISRGEPVIILGEGGAGKSRLVQEVYNALTPPRRLLLASARIMEHSLPFQPLVDLLRREIQAEEWKQMDPVWVAPLALLLPELTIIHADVRAPQVPVEQKHALLFESMRQLFAFLAKRQRFLLFLDNAQWCDASTLSALAYLIERQVFSGDGAFLLAARPEGITPDLENFLNMPRPGTSIRRVSLPPLSHNDTAQIAQFVLGEQYSPRLIERMEQETGGNPLFLLETLRLVLDYALSPQLNQSIDHLPLASSIHALINERLKQLAPNDSQVLSAAAVLGSTFAIGLLEQTSQLPSEQTAQSLERLEQANLVKVGDPGTSQYAFAHEKIREVILLDLSPVRKRLLHLRAAHALEKNQYGQSSEVEGVLAIHYEEAGETAAAFQHWLNAASYAWRLYAKAEASAALQHAEQALQRLGHNISGRDIYLLYRQWARMAFALNDPPRIERACQTLLQFGQVRQDPLLVGSAYRGMAQAAELRQQPEDGLRYLEKALPYLEQSGELLERAEALNHQGLFWMMLGKYAESRCAYEQAIEITAASKEPAVVETRAQTEYRLGLILVVTGWPRRAHELTGQSVKDAEEGFNQVAMLQANSLMSYARCYLGQYRQSREAVLQSLEQSSTIPIPILTGDLLGTAALASLAAGQLDSCWSYARQALRITEEDRSTYLREGMYYVLGELYFFLGDLEQAEAMFSQGSESRLENFHAINNLAQLGLVLAAQGQVEAGLAHIDRVLNHLEEQQATLFTLQARFAKARLFALSGQEAEASAMLEALEVDAGEREIVDIMLKSQVQRAQIALNQRQPGDAIMLAREAAARAQSAGHLLLETEARGLWIDAARMGDMTIPSALGQRLRECIHMIQVNTQIPELRELLDRKAWTKSPEIM